MSEAPVKKGLLLGLVAPGERYFAEENPSRRRNPIDLTPRELHKIPNAYKKTDQDGTWWVKAVRLTQTSPGGRPAGEVDESYRYPWQSVNLKLAFSYLYQPIGWDRFDPKVHRGRPIQAGERVAIWRERIDPMNYFIVVMDQHGNQQAVSRKSIARAAGSTRPVTIRSGDEPFGKTNPLRCPAFRAGERVRVKKTAMGIGRGDVGIVVVPSGPILKQVPGMCSSIREKVYRGEWTVYRKGDGTYDANLTSLLELEFKPNPPGPKDPDVPEVYPETHKITMRRGHGKFKGDDFFHDFGKGVAQHAIPKGAKLTTPGGRRFTVTSNSVLLTSNKNKSLVGKYPV